MHRVRTISIFGLTESVTAEQLTQFKQWFPQFKLGIESKFPEIRVKLYASGSETDKLKDSAAEAIEWVCRKLGNHVFSGAGQSMEQVVGMLLHEKNATLAVAESCTGGLIANLLTDVPGSSDYFLFSAVTYANQAKMKILDVKAETLERHGAVSEQIASEMARGAKHIVDATYGLATSGVAGPGGGTDDKPVGTVCIGLATPLSVSGHRFNFPDHNRRMNKHIFAITALDLLRKELLGA
jgi:nicotinamide-nucleotide amidase